LGYYTVVLTPRRKLLEQRRELTDVHELIYCDLSAMDGICAELDRLRRHGLNIRAVVSFVDPYAAMAARISEAYGGTSLSWEAMARMENKQLTRETLTGTPYGPEFAVIERGDDGEAAWREWKGGLPALLKSPVSTGSKDVCMVTDAAEFVRARNALRKGGDGALLLEAYITGPQVLVEAVALDGEVRLVAVLEQQIEARERFIITGYRLAPFPSEERFPGLAEAARNIITAFGMRTGTCHLEIRRGSTGWKLVEANPRMSGGAMNAILAAGLGIDWAKQSLRLALGERPDIEPKLRRHVYTQHIVLRERGRLLKVTGRSRASRMPYVEEVYVKPRKGAWVQPPMSMGDRYAYVIAAAPTAFEAEQAAKAAAAEIGFHIQPYDS